MSLPIFQDDSRNFMLMQSRWSSQLNPLLQFPLNSGTILKNITLTVGSNSINHLLQRKLQGWILTRVKGPATIYDTQDSNPSPELTLLLTTDADVQVEILVF